MANRTVFWYLRDYEGLEILGLRAGCSNPVDTISAELIHWLRNGPQSVSVGPFCNVFVIIMVIKRNRRSMAALCTSLGLSSMHTVDVEHCTICHGLIIKHKWTGYRVSCHAICTFWYIYVYLYRYSGDTIPVDRLVHKWVKIRRFSFIKLR